VNGILVTVLIVSGVNLLINLSILSLGFLSFFYFIVIFPFNDFSVRTKATMVSFSALLAISLAFAHLQTGWDRIQYSGLILLGGFYLIVSLIFFYIRPNRYAELQIECIN
jgi:hypothetical protein